MKTNPECKRCGILKSTVDDLAPFGPGCTKDILPHDFPATNEKEISSTLEEDHIVQMDEMVPTNAERTGDKGRVPTPSNKKWEDKVREDYKDILHSDIIENSIEYWRGILLQHNKELVKKIGVERCEVPEKPIANKLYEIDIEFIDKCILYAGRVNYNKAIDDVLDIINSKNK